jgi:hypothetical protein
MQDARNPDRLTRARITLSLTAGMVALVLAGCAGAAGGSGEPPLGSEGPPSSSASPSALGIDHPTRPRDLVVRYEETGGFVAPQMLLSRYPVISVYGDGSVITEGPIPMIYPGPALPNLLVRTISEAGIQKLLTLAGDAGLLGPDAAYDGTGIADATTAQFTVVARGSRHTVTAYALGEDAMDTGLDPATAAARARLRQFATALTGLDATLGSGNTSPDSAYRYDEVRIYVTPGAPESGDATISRDPLAWPLSIPLASFGQPVQDVRAGARCGSVGGADLDALMPLMERATQITGWSSGGSTYTLTLHPLLPDQAGCPAPA